MADAVQPIGVNPNPAPVEAPAFVFAPVPVQQNPMPNPFRRLTWRNRPRRRMMYNRDHRERAVALHQRGFSYRQIARRMGPFCSCGTVYQWVRQNRPRAQP